MKPLTKMASVSHAFNSTFLKMNFDHNVLHSDVILLTLGLRSTSVAVTLLITVPTFSSSFTWKLYSSFVNFGDLSLTSSTLTCSYIINTINLLNTGTDTIE